MLFLLQKKLALTWVSRWVMMFLVGIGTSLLAAGVHIAVELVAHQKFHLIAKCILWKRRERDSVLFVFQLAGSVFFL